MNSVPSSKLQQPSSSVRYGKDGLWVPLDSQAGFSGSLMGPVFKVQGLRLGLGFMV